MASFLAASFSGYLAQSAEGWMMIFLGHAKGNLPLQRWREYFYPQSDAISRQLAADLETLP